MCVAISDLPWMSSVATVSERSQSSDVFRPREGISVSNVDNSWGIEEPGSRVLKLKGFFFPKYEMSDARRRNLQHPHSNDINNNIVFGPFIRGNELIPEKNDAVEKNVRYAHCLSRSLRNSDIFATTRPSSCSHFEIMSKMVVQFSKISGFGFGVSVQNEILKF